MQTYLTHTYMHVHIYMYIHTHTYTYIYTHTYIHTYTDRQTYRNKCMHACIPYVPNRQIQHFNQPNTAPNPFTKFNLPESAERSNRHCVECYEKSKSQLTQNMP